jgi:hypothetical protein
MNARRICGCVILVIAVLLWGTAAWGDDFTWEALPVSSNWDNPNNWAGPNLQIPDDNTDRAFVIGDSPGALDPDLTANRTIGELVIMDGGNVSNGDGTNNFVFVVQDNGGLNGTTTIEGIGSDLFIFPTASAIDFDTDQLHLEDGGHLYIYGGARVQVDDWFFTAAGGGAGGNGILEFGSIGTASRNDGALHAGGQGTLIVRAIGTGELDPDGSIGNGILIAYYNSMLHIQAPLSDSVFNGTINIYSNSEIRIDHEWQLGSTGNSELNFDGTFGAGSTDTATLSGASATLSGVVNVNNGTAILAATFASGAGCLCKSEIPGRSLAGPSAR